MLAQLDTKTVYTFMDSMVTIEDYVARAKELGYTHLGMMDRDNLYGAFHFLETCKKNGLQPIVGCELTVTVDTQQVVLQCLARTSQGYRNLLKLSTEKMTGKSEWSILRAYLEGVAVIVPWFDGIQELDLGCEYFIGVGAETPASDQVFSRPILPLHTVRYFEEKQIASLQVLHAIRDNVLLQQVPPIDRQHSLLSPQDFRNLFQERFPEALENLAQLVNDIHYDLQSHLQLPRFNADRPAVEELRERTQQGLKEKGLLDASYQERLAEELNIIHQMGFDDYFLIVWDLVRFGRQKGYYMGMGRGSAVGSLVAYTLDITGIDPVKNNLLFERFLNLERYSMPDIDIDLPDRYRGEFLRYVRERYGTEHTAQIVTYSTFGAKQAIRDVFKRFGAPEYEISQLTKKISYRDTLSSAYNRSAGFRQLIYRKPEYQQAFAIAQTIEGLPRQTSIHAAGVVMSDHVLTDTIPLKQGEEMLVTQYDAHAVEASGLLKMDFLGLRNLTLVQLMAEKVKKETGETIDIAKIDLEDRQTLQLFASGETKGIFQFEQPGAIRLLRRIQPTSFEEVVATTSLNRPGASDYSENFIKRKQGKESVDLLDDSIAHILRPTYGIMLYQEQVMQIAQIYAGFTLGKADLLRRAMSKKDSSEMDKLGQDFLHGSLENGHSESEARSLFDRMAKFAGYGFNRSHAYAYSALAFQLAYFKTHFPEIFFTVMLNHANGDYLADAIQFGFQPAPLRIDTITYSDRLDMQRIFLGMKHIKGMTKDMVVWIEENRPFHSVEEFVICLPENYRKTETLRPLVDIGLFDDLHPNRKQIIENLDSLFIFAEAGLFSDERYSWREAEDYSDAEKFELERSIIGVGFSPHPLISIQEYSPHPFTPIAQLVDGQRSQILIQIQQIRLIRTKKTGEQMAFLRVSDTQNNLDVTLFPDNYRQYADRIEEGGFFYLTGRVQNRDGQLQLIAEKVMLASTEKFWILLEDHQSDEEVARILKEYPGNIPVILHYQKTNETIQAEGLVIEKNEELQEKLKTISMKTTFQ